jgi:hypothetical protein
MKQAELEAFVAQLPNVQQTENCGDPVSTQSENPVGG